jgi:hypothetical protein
MEDSLIRAERYYESSAKMNRGVVFSNFSKYAFTRCPQEVRWM